MIYRFWDQDWDEPCGILEVDKAPEVGDNIVSGFVRYKSDTVWTVVGKERGFVLITRKELEDA